jgi:hypothetical protein
LIECPEGSEQVYRGASVWGRRYSLRGCFSGEIARVYECMTVFEWRGGVESGKRGRGR